MTKNYVAFEKLSSSYAIDFSKLTLIQNQIDCTTDELHRLQEKKKTYAIDLIRFLRKYHYNGICNKKALAYLYMPRYTPSFNAVFKKAMGKLYSKDRAVLTATYADLSNEKELEPVLIVKTRS